MRHALLWLTLAALLTSCGVGERPTLVDDAAAADADDATSTTSTTDPDALDEDTDLTLVVTAIEPTIELFDAALADDPADVLDVADHLGETLVFVVIEDFGDRLVVLRPDTGEEAWVDREAISLARHRFRIEIDRDDATLRVFEAGAELVEFDVTLGDDAPETSSSFITELVTPPEDSGFGSYAYGLSGRVNTLDDFESGSGVVAIHAVSADSEEEAVSVGLSDADLAHLVVEIGLPLGTPVEFI